MSSSKDAKRGPGRPPYVPDPRVAGRVEALVSFGMPHKMIAKELGMSVNTLRQYYREELDDGKARANAKVAQVLFRQAMGDADRGVPPNLTACIFWLKTQAGWRETSNVEMSGPDGGPIQTEAVAAAKGFDFSHMSLERKKELKAELVRARKDGD